MKKSESSLDLIWLGRKSGFVAWSTTYKFFWGWWGRRRPGTFRRRCASPPESWGTSGRCRAARPSAGKTKPEKFANSFVWGSQGKNWQKIDDVFPNHFSHNFFSIHVCVHVCLHVCALPMVKNCTSKWENINPKKAGIKKCWPQKLPLEEERNLKGLVSPKEHFFTESFSSRQWRTSIWEGQVLTCSFLSGRLRWSRTSDFILRSKYGLMVSRRTVAHLNAVATWVLDWQKVQD